jgi:mannose-6-phosphate isomerase-like protein (cupin superfamily)
MALKLTRLVVALPLMLLGNAMGQTARVDVYTAEQMRASPAALPQGILQRYPNHYTMLITRHEDGQSELHAHIADVFFVVEGEAALWTGGTMESGKATDPGELRGSGLKGATSVSLKRGDVVHIPANVPHQLRLTRGTTFTYFVVKVAEQGDIPR